MAKLTVNPHFGAPTVLDHSDFAVIQPSTNHDDPNATCYVFLQDGTKLVLTDNFHDVWGAVCHHTQVARGIQNPTPLPAKYGNNP